MVRSRRRPFVAHLSLLFALLSLRGDSQPTTRIVVIGDSITAHWNLSSAFPDYLMINAGIGGQTSVDMLARFETDVLDRKPDIVIIEAGTNDLYNDAVPTATTHANIETMIALAQTHDIRVVVAGTIPVSAVWYQFRNPQKIEALNAWLRSTAVARDASFVDYYAVLAGHPELTVDGLHPNAAGYERLARALYDAITTF